MAAPVLESSTLDVETTSETSHSINKPTGVTTGDLLIMMICFEDDTGTVTGPSGFTEVGDVEPVDVGPVFHNFVYYKVATGSEPSSYTVTTTNSVNGALFLLRISGAEDPATTPIVITDNSGVLYSPDPYEYPSVTPTENESLVFHFGVLNAETFNDYVSGDTAVTTFNFGSYTTDVQIGYEENNASATGTETASVSAGSTDWVAFSFAIAPGTPSINNNITFFMSGYLPESGNFTLFEEGHGSESGTPTLFTEGHEPTNNSTTLFIENVENSSGNMTLFVDGLGFGSSVFTLHTVAFVNDSGNFTLFEEGHYPHSGEHTLFIKGHEVHTGSMPLFTFTPSGVPKTASTDLFIWSMADSGVAQTMPLYMNSLIDPNYSMNLFISGPNANDNTINMNLFICNDTTITDAITLFMQNEYTLDSGVVPLYISTASGTDGAIPFSGTMPLFINREIESISHVFPLYAQTSEPSTSGITLYINSTGSGDFNNLTLFTQANDLQNSNVRLYTHGF